MNRYNEKGEEIFATWCDECSDKDGVSIDGSPGCPAVRSERWTGHCGLRSSKPKGRDAGTIQNLEKVLRDLVEECDAIAAGESLPDMFGDALVLAKRIIRYESKDKT